MIKEEHLNLELKGGMRELVSLEQGETISKSHDDEKCYKYF